MKKVYSAQEIQFIRDNYPANGTAWVAEKLGKTQAQIKSFARNHKLVRTNYYISEAAAVIIASNLDLSFQALSKMTGESISRIKTFVYSRKMKPTEFEFYSDADNQFVWDNYKLLSNTEIAAKIGRSADSVKNKIQQYSLRRTKEQLSVINARLNSASWFQNGSVPPNTKHDGYISTRIDSNGNPYRHIRIELGKFELLHRYNWMQQIGPIPEDKILRSKDGDSLNCDPINWELVDRAEHLSMNSGRGELTDAYVVCKLTHRRPDLKPAIAEMPELIELKRNQIKLKRTINELT